MASAKNSVAAGLAAIDKRRQSVQLGKFLEMLDQIDVALPDDRIEDGGQPIRRPYSGQELPTEERWRS